MCHLGEVTDAKELQGDKNSIDSKWGLTGGLYEHPASLPIEPLGPNRTSAYGEAWTIYHTDRPQGNLLTESHLEETEPMRIMKSLLGNKWRALNSSERPQKTDMIVYWVQHPHNTKEWSPVYAGLISDISSDGTPTVSSGWRTGRNGRTHNASDPGFPYTSSAIYRTDTLSNSEIEASTSN
jgi:hypothetical protein